MRYSFFVSGFTAAGWAALPIRTGNPGEHWNGFLYREGEAVWVLYNQEYSARHPFASRVLTTSGAAELNRTVETGRGLWDLLICEAVGAIARLERPPGHDSFPFLAYLFW